MGYLGDYGPGDDGAFLIQLPEFGLIWIYCDFTTDGGGWMVGTLFDLPIKTYRMSDLNRHLKQNINMVLVAFDRTNRLAIRKQIYIHYFTQL